MLSWHSAWRCKSGVQQLAELVGEAQLHAGDWAIQHDRGVQLQLFAAGLPAMYDFLQTLCKCCWACDSSTDGACCISGCFS